VPFSAPHDAILSVSFGDNRRSDSVPQRPKRAHNGPPAHESKWEPSVSLDALKAQKTPLDGGASMFDCDCYYATFLRLDIPTNPIKAVPNSQTAAGIGTADTQGGCPGPPQVPKVILPIVDDTAALSKASETVPW
jgi:hypothetical protein